MRKLRWFIFCILFLFPMGILFTQTQEADSLFEQHKNGIVSVVASGENKDEVGRGTGFIIGDGDLIVTCYHIVSNAYNVEAVNIKGKKFKVEGIVAVGRDFDLALLKIKGKLPALSLGDSDNLRTANRIFAIGGKETSLIMVSEGSIIDFLEYTPGKRIIKGSLNFREGISGGPLLGLEGQVIGVVVSLEKDIEFIVPINRLKPLLGTPKLTNFKNWEHEDYLSSPAGALLAGKISLFVGEPGKARNYLEKVVKADPNNIEAYSGLASANFQLKYYDTAISAFKKIIELDPKREESHYNLGLIYFRMRRFQEAVTPLKRTIEINPQNMDAYLQLGNIYEELKDFQNAADVYIQYLDTNPQSKWAGYFRLGICYREIGKNEEAIDALNKALEEKPDDAGILTKLAETYQIASKFDNAAENYEKLAQLAPDQATFFYGKVVKMFDSAGQYEKAIKAAEKIVELNPSSELAVYNLGIMYSKMGKNEEAIETFRKSLLINPNYDLAYYNIGLNYFSLKNFKEAVAAFQKFIEITPDNADAWYNIGVGYMQLKNFEAALEPLRKSVELRPDNGLALYNLAITYLNLKDKYSAKEVYNQLLTTDPEYASKLKQYIK